MFRSQAPFSPEQEYAVWPWFKFTPPTRAVYYGRQASYRAIASEGKKKAVGLCVCVCVDPSTK